MSSILTSHAHAHVQSFFTFHGALAMAILLPRSHANAHVESFHGALAMAILLPLKTSCCPLPCCCAMLRPSSSLALVFLAAILLFVSFSALLAPPLTSCPDLPITHQLGRKDFPHGFVFGTASSAYQYEGAADMDGRGPSIWDTFSRTEGNIVGGTNGNVASDQYHLYKEDIKLMAAMGVDAYRFSISWSRLFPEGKGRLNHIGATYYNRLIDGLIKKGIQPHVTLYHWDLPQTLEDIYGGWLSPLIVDDFAAYADTCFQLFGDRVKHWITFNEPNIFIQMGYDMGLFPPRRCSSWIRNCSAGNSATEPYVAAHNVLLSHAAAVDIYKRKYQEKQAGRIGMSISLNWYVPLKNSTEDLKAAQRILEFQLGWFMDPIMHGDYPAVMRKLVGSRLPTFSEEQQLKLKEALDFIGINHYTTVYTTAVDSNSEPTRTDFFRDSLTILTSERDGVPIGRQAASEWLYMVPSGIYHAVKYVTKKYNNLPLFITENGMDDLDNGSLTLEKALHDDQRVQFHHDYLWHLSAAIREGADVRGYFAWSLLDNFEWASGYTLRFGFHYVDYKTLKRYPKDSAKWFKKFLANKRHDKLSQYYGWLYSTCMSSLPH